MVVPPNLSAKVEEVYRLSGNAEQLRRQQESNAAIRKEHEVENNFQFHNIQTVNSNFLWSKSVEFKLSINIKILENEVKVISELTKKDGNEIKVISVPENKILFMKSKNITDISMQDLKTKNPYTVLGLLRNYDRFEVNNNEEVCIYTRG